MYWLKTISIYVDRSRVGCAGNEAHQSNFLYIFEIEMYCNKNGNDFTLISKKYAKLNQFDFDEVNS
jgi:hypothetical protein